MKSVGLLETYGLFETRSRTIDPIWRLRCCVRGEPIVALWFSGPKPYVYLAAISDMIGVRKT